MTLTRPVRNKENVDRRRGVLEEDATHIKTWRGKKALVRGGGASGALLAGHSGEWRGLQVARAEGQSEGENTEKWTWAVDRPATQASTS